MIRRSLKCMYNINKKSWHMVKKICYSSHGVNNKLLVRYSGHGLNNEPFNEQTILDHSNTEQVCYSDPHCILNFMKYLLTSAGIWILGKSSFWILKVCPVASNCVKTGENVWFLIDWKLSLPCWNKIGFMLQIPNIACIKC